MDYLLLFVYSILIVLCSTLGGMLPSFLQFTHRRIQLTLSLVSGVMLGVAMLHLLPHSIQILNNDIRQAMMAALAGLLFMFLLIRTFHFHQHDVPGETSESNGHCDHDHHDHHHHDEHIHPEEEPPAENVVAAHSRDLSWAGLSFGLALHTLVDGLALAAAYSAERSHSSWAGLGTFLAIVLHKPMDALTITSLMSARKASATQQMIVNLIFALMCPLGAILFTFSFDQWELLGPSAIGITLAFSAGVFLCISLGDLLPEVHFHSHDRVPLSLMLLLGVGIAYLIEFVIPHQHSLQ
ncbi:MAG: ZIP family metal transporter [Pirellulaceae bacterium]